jgi:hypothetical protein
MVTGHGGLSSSETHMTKAKQTPAKTSRKAKTNAAPKPSRGIRAGKTEKSTAVAPPSSTKREIIAALARRAQGATMADLIAATSWQAHSIRAVISGFRKTGSTVARDKTSDGATRYRIEKSA